MTDIAIVGAGTMGAGIAESAASAGLDALLVDVREEALESARAGISRNLGRRVEKGRISEGERDEALSRISTDTSLAACADSAFVVEAVVEELGIKAKVFAGLEAVVSPETVLATNTSSLSVARIAAPADRPERVAGMHFFNPVPAMRLVEVVAGPATAERTAEAVASMAERLGKTPIHVSDTPGFVVNRVARPFYLEALRMVEAGEEPARVDAALRGAGFRMGPLQLADLIGHDVNLAVSESVFERYYFAPRFRPSVLQRSMVEADLLGRKSGRGFYEYGEREGTEEPDELEGAVLRVVSCIVNEAFVAVSEGVASEEAVDKAMKLGANYPKGPFEWAESLGCALIVETLDSLREAYGDAYIAAPSLRGRV